MGKTVLIHQNPNLVSVGGFEHTGKNLFAGSKVNFGISSKNNKLNLDLTKEETKKIENYYNKNLDSKEGVEYYTGLIFEMNDKTISWDLDSPENLLKYKAGIAAGIIAVDKKEVENPRCKAIFYVYDADAESEYISKLNELKGEVVYQLTKLKKDNPDKIITYAKYLFNSQESYTPVKAYNKLIEYAEKHTKTKPTLTEITKLLSLPYQDIEFDVLIQTSINRNIIVKNKNGEFINRESMTAYGKTTDDIKQYLKNNPDEVGEGKSNDKVYALKRLLKH